MDLEKLKDYIDFMNEHSLSELEIEEQGKRIRLKKFSQEQPVLVSSMPTASSNQAKESSTETEKTSNTIEIKSPMVGTFYRSPAPGAKPYVEVGDTIKAGDTVCIVEAMKLMNEIKAEKGGKIVKIIVENGQPVEFGQPLFALEAV